MEKNFCRIRYLEARGDKLVAMIGLDRHASEEEVVIITGVGPDTTGWLLVLDRDVNGAWRLERLDEINSVGLTLHDGLVYRVLCSGGDGSPGELMVYDAAGVVAYRRVDGLVDPHAMVWDGKHFAVPCPAVNGIAMLDRFGTVSDWIGLPGHGDAWHVNGVAMHRGHLYASAFGAHRSDRGWGGRHEIGDGLVFRVRDRQKAFGGLHCPHDPNFIDGSWVVCDSATQRLIEVAEHSGDIVREAKLGAWTRGVAFDDAALYVGLSAQRHAAGGARLGALAILDRRTWRVLERIALPCEEVNTVAHIPRTMLGALRRGFRTNAMRTSVQDREDMFRKVGNVHPSQPMTPMTALDPTEAKIQVNALAPAGIIAGQRFDLSVTIRNQGPRTLFSAMPFPVNIGYRWMLESDDREIDPLDGRRHALPLPIEPGKTLHLAVPIVAPSSAGNYRLQMTLVQEWQRWFDADDAAMGVTLHLAIGALNAASIDDDMVWAVAADIASGAF